MSKGLIYSTRGVTSPTFKHLLQKMKLVETNSDTIDFLSSYKTDRPVKHVEEVSGLKFNNHINHLVEQYTSTFSKMKSWEEIYDALDVEFLKDYDDLYLYGGLFSTGSNLRRYTKRCGVFPKDSGQIKFISTAVPCVYTLALLKANRLWNIRLHEVSLDPLEISLDLFHPDYLPTSNYHLYHGHAKPSLNIKRLDHLQYYLQQQDGGLFKEELPPKDVDITFGMTVVEGFRQKYAEDAKRMMAQFPVSQFYVRNTVTGEDNYLDRTGYYNQIARSKYTIVMPAYDMTIFSITRTIEALHVDCLPILHSDCYIQDMNECFGIDFGRLVTDSPWSENERLQLLTEFKQAVLPVTHTFCK